MKNLKYILLVLILFINVSASADDWKDRLSKARDNIKSATEKVKETKNKAKQKWEESEKRCSICGEIMHGSGNVCASCRIKQASKKAKEFGESTKKKYSEIKESTKKASAKIREKSPEVLAVMKQKYDGTLSKIRDPENRAKATKTVTTVLEVRRKFKEMKRGATYKSFQALTSIPVSTEYGNITFGEFATDLLLEKCPELEGTGIADDPAATVTAMICTDRKFFLEKAKLVKKNGRNISVYEAVEESSAFNSAKASKAFAVMAATERVVNTYQTGEDSIEALTSVADAINSVNE